MKLALISPQRTPPFRLIVPPPLDHHAPNRERRRMQFHHERNLRAGRDERRIIGREFRRLEDIESSLAVSLLEDGRGAVTEPLTLWRCDPVHEKAAVVVRAGLSLRSGEHFDVVPAGRQHRRGVDNVRAYTAVTGVRWQLVAQKRDSHDVGR